FIHGTANLAGGTLGDGGNTLDVAGTLNTSAPLNLGNGDDTLVIRDGTQLAGVVDAGNGINTVSTVITTSAVLQAVQNFQALDKSGTGSLRVTGPSTFQSVTVNTGTLLVDSTGSLTAKNTTVGANTVVQLDGAFLGTAGDDVLTVAGTIAGAGGVNLGD